MFQDWASLTSNETIKEENYIMNKQCKCIFHNDRVLISILEFFNILEKKRKMHVNYIHSFKLQQMYPVFKILVETLSYPNLMYLVSL